MQTEDSIKITKRFFSILYYLTKIKAIRGKATFARQYGVSQPSLRRLEREPHSDIMQIVWLFYLVRDFDVSAEWLLTGRGKRFTIEPEKKEKYLYKERNRKRNNYNRCL
jgi:hypothetical protein